MRLTHIKLAGFKSFVDPTTIPVPGHLVAVCGPNGCGKSNVIDAVRWVLGESSAKQLRGESMQDVIFNGSTTRKAVSRAAVELVFDNQAGLAAGAWSSYAEISIKRVLTRQGDSSYFINHQAVRRRDITDLFLGTGVGKSGYAIIEQGMISRIIEAKPEELRHFLEEAAGVSKYKERRRETEHRIADTRDNLSRVADIQLELQAQIDKLSSQASVAQHYQALQQQISEKEQLLALQRKLDAAQAFEAAKLNLLQAQTALDAALAGVRESEAQLEALRESHFIASDALHAAQSELYAANAEVARMEQTLLHQKQSRERLSAQLHQCEQEGQKLSGSLQQITSDLAQQQAQLADLELDVEEAHFKVEEASLALPDQEQALHAADAAWEALRDQVNALVSSQKLIEQQIQFISRNRQSLLSRQTQLNTELQRLAPVAPIEDWAEQIDILQLELAELELQQEDTAAEQLTAQQLCETSKQAIQQLQTEILQYEARESALRDVLLDVENSAEFQAWLTQEKWVELPKIIDCIQVEAGWELAVEAILGARLQGYLANSPLSVPPSQVFVADLDCQLGTTFSLQHIEQTLLAKVSSSKPELMCALRELLGLVFCVEDLAALNSMQSELQDGMTIVTRQGHIATRHSVFYFAGQTSESGRLARQAELRRIEGQLALLQPRSEQASERLGVQELHLEQIQQRLHTQQDQIQQRKQAVLHAENQRIRQQDLAEQAQARHAAIHNELQDIERQSAQEALELEQLSQALAEQQQQLAVLHADEVSTRAARDGLQQSQSQQSVQVREMERAAQAAVFALQTAEQKIRSLQQRQLENEGLLQQQQQRFSFLQQEREALLEPEFDAQFQAAITVRAEKERLLATARDALNQFAQTMRDYEAQKQLAEKALEAQREVVNQMRLVEQEARLNVERFTAELLELAVDEAALLPLLGRSVKALLSEMTRLTQQLSSLGPVNLAAMQELAASQERQVYLTEQATDLEQAMSTLAAAIARIDKETRHLLQTTYDTVNANLQELFPALFGGGHAELILTGDEILDAGMSIMAQPPGKKNATIHLLSGGEKALTALSLVFSLFKLNPAPFCLLDEVDAPLDDANTLRFCELVKKMAQYTQFLYISHNKLTMEMAQQLVGVTMQEQGVSRIVAVDIEQALKMREPELI